MYTILVVDDEKLICDGIISRLVSFDIKFEMVLQAYNGIEALEIAKTNKIDIIITDVRMPKMNGMDFIREVREFNSSAKIIILSGYAEFEYAQLAIKFGVSGYLLKPISNSELKNVITSVVEDLNQAGDVNTVYSSKKRLEMQNRDLALEQKINQICHTSNISIDMDFFPDNADMTCQNLIVAVLNIDRQTYEESQFRHQEVDLIKYSLSNIFTEMDCECSKLIVNNYSNSNQLLAVIYHKNADTLIRHSSIFLGKYYNFIKNNLNVIITIGLSCTNTVLTNQLYNEAVKAFHQRIISGYGIYFYKDIVSNENITVPQNEIHLLQKYIERGDITNIETILHEIFSAKDGRKMCIAYLKLVWKAIFNVLYNQNLSFINNEKMPNFLDRETLNKFSTIDDIVSYLYSTIVEMLSLSDKNIMSANCTNKIKLAQNYIEQNYHKEISVNELANQYAMTPTYFSTVFKKETGVTIIKYLSQVKINKACELLTQTSLSIVDIALKVGYDDSQYFFRVFKKIIGKTPLEYRRDNYL